MNETTKPNESLLERNDVRELVRKRYGEAALAVLQGKSPSCCSSNGDICCGEARKSADSGACCPNSDDPITGDLYSKLEASEIPEEALLASLGCGNPTALAALKPGETVLDLGSGGGIDVLLSAKRVGPSGLVYGLDMTDEMLALAEENKARACAENVEFLKGHIEEIPLPGNSVDVIISNCVINLSADKDAVLSEAYRVLKPGGRLAVSDIVVDGNLPDSIRRDMESYVGCIAGALEKDEYLTKLQSAGFVETSIEPTRRYSFSDFEGSWAPRGVAKLPEDEKLQLDGKIFGGFIRATKPGESA